MVLLPGVSITHLGGATLGRRYRAVLPTVYAGYYTFLRRYHGPAAEWVARVALGFLWSAALAVGWGVLWLISRGDRARMLMHARRECVRFAFSPLASPEVFAHLVRSPGGVG